MHGCILLCASPIRRRKPQTRGLPACGRLDPMHHQVLPVVSRKYITCSPARQCNHCGSKTSKRTAGFRWCRTQMALYTPYRIRCIYIYDRFTVKAEALELDPRSGQASVLQQVSDKFCHWFFPIHGKSTCLVLVTSASWSSDPWLSML